MEPMTAKRRVSTPATLEPKVPVRRCFHHCYHHSLNYRHCHHNFHQTQNICGKAPFISINLPVIISLLPSLIFQLFVRTWNAFINVNSLIKQIVDNTDCLKALPCPLMLLTLKSKCAFHGFWPWAEPGFVGDQFHQSLKCPSTELTSLLNDFQARCHFDLMGQSSGIYGARIVQRL